MNKYLLGLIAVISLSVGIIGFYLIKNSNELPAPEFALHYQQPRTITNFSFTDELGQTFQNEQLNGKWSFIFLGYTSCPDVCPMTLQKLHVIYDDLLKVTDKTQVILVSVDPQRDTQEKLSQYIAYFNPDFKAVRADHDVLFPFARSIGLMYAITDYNSDSADLTNSSTTDKNYWVDHSASMVLINPEGKVAAIFKPEQKAGEVPHIDKNKLVSDYPKIVALYQKKSLL
ncbi:SCO family protein [Colwellia sp. E2M01]|uniref:SCO family protein n=1 Tax=Colwellia sp. E2M01 TaxID=2841561 RepID=UPI001C091536|nr:SCO family protein [Colwellia sp. E2M01]MBU2869529.1 SCO family protein [Colwellia sp. E2M01]